MFPGPESTSIIGCQRPLTISPTFSKSRISTKKLREAEARSAQWTISWKTLLYPSSLLACVQPSCIIHYVALTLLFHPRPTPPVHLETSAAGCPRHETRQANPFCPFGRTFSHVRHKSQAQGLLLFLFLAPLPNCTVALARQTL